MKLYKECISIGPTANDSLKETLYNIRCSILENKETEKFKKEYMSYGNDYRRRRYPEIYENHLYSFFSVLGIYKNKTTAELAKELDCKRPTITDTIYKMIWFYEHVFTQNRHI